MAETEPDPQPSEEPAVAPENEPTEQAAARGPRRKWMVGLTSEGLAEANRELGDLEKESKRHRLAARDAQAQLAQLKQANEERDRKALEEQGKFKDLWEQERKGREADVAIAQKRHGRAVLKMEAVRAGIINPDDIDFLPATAFELDPSGEVTGVAEAIESLKKTRPYLFQSPAEPGPRGAASSGSTARPNERTDNRAVDTRAMKPEEYAAFKQQQLRKLRA